MEFVITSHASEQQVSNKQKAEAAASGEGIFSSPLQRSSALQKCSRFLFENLNRREESDSVSCAVPATALARIVFPRSASHLSVQRSAHDIAPPYKMEHEGLTKLRALHTPGGQQRNKHPSPHAFLGVTGAAG